VEVLDWVLTAGRFPFPPDVLDGAVLLIETSEELLPARSVGWIVRSLGERGSLLLSTASWWPDRRCPTSVTGRTRPSEPGSAPSSEMWWSGWSPPTTPKL
jgi:hypothetical protein